MKYSVKLITFTGRVSYLSFKGKTAWCKRIATKHLLEFQALHKQHYTALLEEHA
jgi:hypothetical protein